ncbi:class I adenylate-forming enzyme family protein [Streptomyces aureocirculatus]|uniref:class I adenylate-forming enzyme family protein n=1 Tax=Streptomyces aureocirculatus TaxID=67275 RepID=UPI0004C9F7EC|nr:class I adenylate-forming enzyme family protein [Streptomyces aureocirculatus]
MPLHLPASRRPLRLGMIPEEAAARHPGTPLVLDHDMDAAPAAGRELTVGGLADLVDDMAARLWAAGVRAGEHLALYKAHNFDIYVLACAASRLGAVPVLLSPALDGPTVGALLDRLERPHLLTDEGKLADELAGLDLAEAAAAVVVPSGDRPGTVSLESLAGSPRRAPVLLDGHHPALMTHTSGTTGIPKLVVHTALSLRGRYRPQDYLVGLIRRRETYAVHVSFVHSRMYMALAVMLERGMPVVVIDHGAPDEVAPLLARTRPGIVETHPNTYVEWAELADHPLKPLANVKYFSGTFDAIHPPTIHKLLSGSRRTNPLFFQFYGQSECGPLVARWYTKKNALSANGRCLGYPLPGMTHVRVVPREGRRPTKRTPGFIEVLSDGRAVTYYAEDERYRKELNGTWWRTGDVGYRDRLGRVHVLDRAVDVIPNVDSTLEVEDAVLGRLDELLELVLVPGPDKEPLPVVCTKDNVPLDPIRWRRAVVDFPQLADPIQLPLSELPRTATMKVQRIELTRRLHERLERTG